MKRTLRTRMAGAVVAATLSISTLSAVGAASASAAPAGTGALTGVAATASPSPEAVALRAPAIRSVTVKDKSRGSHIVGRFKVTPTVGLVGKKLTFQVKKGKKWKRYKRVKLRATGIMKVSFRGSRKGIRYRLVVPAAAGYSGYIYGPYIARLY